MNRMLRPWSVLAAAGLAVVSLNAAGSTTLVVLPEDLPGNNVVGVADDGAPGFQHGSIRANGQTKAEFYAPADVVFDRSITMGEIAAISFWTNKPTDHVSDPPDWYLNIYTKPFPNDVSSQTWYGSRFGSEPYFSASLSESVGAWNQWSTDDITNVLRFFESTQGAPGANFGTYTDPHWTDFLGGMSLGTAVPIASQEVLYISLQTASAHESGFIGKVDGLRVELTDGTIVKFNFEPFLTPVDRDSCKKDGWLGLRRPNGTPFVNQGECVSFVSTGN